MRWDGGGNGGSGWSGRGLRSGRPGEVDGLAGDELVAGYNGGVAGGCHGARLSEEDVLAGESGHLLPPPCLLSDHPILFSITSRNCCCIASYRSIICHINPLKKLRIIFPDNGLARCATTLAAFSPSSDTKLMCNIHQNNNNKDKIKSNIINTQI